MESDHDIERREMISNLKQDESEYEKQIKIRAIQLRELEYDELIDSQLDLLDDSELVLLEELLAGASKRCTKKR